MKYINDPEKEFLNNLILSKNNISEQLILLRKYKDRKDVQDYINNLKEKTTSEYLKYLIARYYDGDSNAKKAEKNCVERMFKVLLRPVQIREKKDKNIETDIEVGDTVFVCYRSLDHKDLTGEDKAVVISIDKEYDVATIKQNLFGEEVTYDIDIEDIKKIN